MGVIDIKLLVCCHRPVQIPSHPLLVPIQVGAALADTHFLNYLHDDTGDNISQKNRFYCELTAHYWAWKNTEADYYGFFHYRRYLYPDMKARRPYRVEREPSSALLEKLGYSEFARLIEQYDLIFPKGEDMHLSVREHYACAPYHYHEDLALVEEIIRQHYPKMVPALRQYFSDTICYFGNIFIMKQDIFYDYCAWLFPILEEFDHCTDWKDRTPQELRVDGYLAERLFGVYLTHRRAELHTLELPRVHFEPNTIVRRKKQLLDAVLPPGSKRRSIVKKAIQRREN